MKSSSLNNGAFLLFALIIVGLAIHALTAKPYAKSNESILQASLAGDFFITYGDLESLLVATHGEGTGTADGSVGPAGLSGLNSHLFPEGVGKLQIIDLREPGEFAAGHLPGAVNIPAGEILHREYRKVFRGNKTLRLIYAAEEHEAAVAAMMLMGRGAEHIRVIPGGFTMVEAHLLSTGTLDPAYRFFRDDKARFDYPRYMQVSPARQQEERNAPAIPELRTQVVSVQGGC